jgi:hypothetical protein
VGWKIWWEIPKRGIIQNTVHKQFTIALYQNNKKYQKITKFISKIKIQKEDQHISNTTYTITLYQNNKKYQKNNKIHNPK